jgi:hypothetical protein
MRDTLSPERGLVALDGRGLAFRAPSGAEARFSKLPGSGRGYGWRITGDARRPSGWYLLGDMLRLARVLGCAWWQVTGTEAEELSRD